MHVHRRNRGHLHRAQTQSNPLAGRFRDVRQRGHGCGLNSGLSRIAKLPPLLAAAEGHRLYVLLPSATLNTENHIGCPWLSSGLRRNHRFDLDVHPDPERQSRFPLPERQGFAHAGAEFSGSRPVNICLRRSSPRAIPRYCGHPLRVETRAASPPDIDRLRQEVKFVFNCVSKLANRPGLVYPKHSAVPISRSSEIVEASVKVNRNHEFAIV